MIMDISGVGAASRLHAVSGASSSGPPQQQMSSLMASLRADNSSQSGSGSQNSLTASLQSLNQIDPSSVPSTASPGSLLNIKA